MIGSCILPVPPLSGGSRLKHGAVRSPEVTFPRTCGTVRRHSGQRGGWSMACLQLEAQKHTPNNQLSLSAPAHTGWHQTQMGHHVQESHTLAFKRPTLCWDMLECFYPAYLALKHVATSVQIRLLWSMKLLCVFLNPYIDTIITQITKVKLNTARNIKASQRT